MNRRRRVVFASVAILFGMAIVALVTGVLVLDTDWGRERVRQLVVREITKALAPHGHFSTAHLDVGLDGQLTADAVVLTDDSGAVVASVARVEAQASVTGLITGRVRISRLLLVRPYLLIERRDTTWNIARIFGSAPKSAVAPRSALSVTLDSAEIQDGRVLVVMPDTLSSLPPVRRDFSRLAMILGRTRVVHPDTAGGAALVHRLAMESSLPPISLRSAHGALRWWSDSLALSFPELRLPASRTAASGTISWAMRGPARLALQLDADSVSLSDVAWISPMIPKRGTGAAKVNIRNGALPRDIDYALTDLEVHTATSNIRGGFVATAGHRTLITRLALDLAPLDLDQIREILGDAVPKKVWQGALTGRVSGGGGPLGALRLDSVALTFTDRRARGAVSHATLSGMLDASSKPAVLNGMHVEIHDLDVRTLGAISKVADSLHGVLTGDVTLDGPTSDLRFHNLLLTHIDGAWPRSTLHGEGRLASDVSTDWFDAALTLDSIAPAAWLRDSTVLRRATSVNGTLELRARRDTMSINAALRSAAGSVQFTGASLLDSSRTWVRGRAALSAVDPRRFLRRRDVPALALTGVADVDIAGPQGHIEAHADVALDTTSVVGQSRLSMGRVRVGIDSGGFHVDTAEVHSRDWRLSAQGRLARTGTANDTLTFAVAFDSLDALRSIVLDSAGAPMLDSLRGALIATGRLVGSLDTLSLDADFGVRDAQAAAVTVRRGVGHASLARLPANGTGFVTLTVDSASSSGFTASRVSVRADIADGREAVVRASVSAADSLTTQLVARGTRDGDSTRVVLDSLDVRLGAGRWHLEHATTIAVGPGRLRVDSTSLRSVLGATLSVSADLPDDGPIRGTLAMRGFTASELAFFNLISAEVGGRVSADVSITGTRSAPRMTGRAQFDSASVNGRAAPSLSLAATYADRRLQAEAHGTFNTREVLAVRGSLPLDLRLRSVATRKVDDSLSVTVRADSATLDGLEAVVPGVEGLRGTVTANVDIRGSWNSVQPLGTVRLRGGAFTLPQMGFVAQDIVMDDTLARDTVNIHARMTDGNGPRNSFAIDGAAWLADGKWRTDITSVGRGFRVADDPRFATADANWLVHFTGLASEPSLEGDLALFNTSLVLGAQRKVRTLRSDSAGGAATESVRKAHISSLRVFLGTNVRLKSRDANVGLSGDLELSGPMTHPYVTGEVYAERGTYRVNLGVLKRTFRVDSGSVLVAGTFNVAQATIDPPATLDIWTSYVVRRSEQDDITVRAHLTGTPDAPRLALASSDLGTSVAQSEIISYLIFGTPSFGVDQLADRAANTALVPYVGGLLEGVLGTLFPFFSSLQVATIQGNNLKGLTTSPVDGLLNSFALSAGRQMGSDSFLNLSGGVCRGSRLASTTSPPGWFSVSAEYRPKRGPSGVVSVEPSASPCSGLSRYQFGLDIFRDWRF